VEDLGFLNMPKILAVLDIIFTSSLAFSGEYMSFILAPLSIPIWRKFSK
jgi:hypothetical protein